LHGRRRGHQIQVDSQQDKAFTLLLTVSPSSKPGVSMTVNVKPADVREMTSGLGVSLWNAETLATLSLNSELAVELFPAPLFPSSKTVSSVRSWPRSRFSSSRNDACVAAWARRQTRGHVAPCSPQTLNKP
jgi:hypothetical protein